MGLKVLLNEVKVSSICDNIIFPNCFNGPDQRMVNFNIVCLEDGIGLANNKENVLLPLFCKLREFNNFANTLVDQMLDFSISVEF